MFSFTRPQSPKTTKTSTFDPLAMGKKSSLTSFKAKKAWLKPPTLPAQKAVKSKAANTLQTEEILTTDEEEDEDEVDDPPDQNLMTPTTRTMIKKKKLMLKKTKMKNEKTVDTGVEVEAEVEAEAEVEEEAEDEVVIEVATKEAIEIKKIITTIMPTRTTMSMVNRLKAMPLDLKPDEVVNDHEEALIEVEAEVEAEVEDEVEDEAETITSLSLVTISQPRPKLKTKFSVFESPSR